MVCVRMTPEEVKMLDRIARAIGRSRSETIRLCILFVDVYLTRNLTLVEILKPLPEVIDYIASKSSQSSE